MPIAVLPWLALELAAGGAVCALALVRWMGRRQRGWAALLALDERPTAIVAASDESYAQAETFAKAAAARRPLQIFRELHTARRWLDEQPDPAPAPDPLPEK